MKPVRPITSPAATLCLHLLAFASAVQSAELQLRLLETTDLHMNLLSYDYYQDKTTDQYGLSRAATLIKAARAEMPNSLLIDNGDLLQGNPMGDFVAKVKPLKDGEVHPAYKVMNQLGYDVGNLGNHEFNFGLPFLRRAIAGANFPYVNANVFLDDKKPAGSAGFLSSRNTFALTYGKLAPAMARRRNGRPKLNSWLPRLPTS